LLFFLSFLLGICFSARFAQFLRRAADRNPSFLAQLLSFPQLDTSSESIRARLDTEILSGPKQEISSPIWLQSATPFVVLYDASGHALTGNATYHGTLPQPPHGIFNTIHQRSEFKVTWQPQLGIRVALTGRPMPNGRFVVTGQSLAPSEARTARLNRLLLWMELFATLACPALVLLTPTRKPAAQIPPSASPAAQNPSDR
jgi:hypothetical protein